MRSRGGIGVLVAIAALLTIVVAGLLSGGGRPVNRAYELEQRLRCPVCKSVSIAESMSDTAAAMRDTVVQQIQAGRSDDEIVDYFTARYGQWVLMDPPRSGDTLALWVIPMGAALAGLVLVLTRRRARGDPAELTEAERAQVADAVRRMRAAAEQEDRL